MTATKAVIGDHCHLDDSRHGDGQPGFGAELKGFTLPFSAEIFPRFRVHFPGVATIGELHRAQVPTWQQRPTIEIPGRVATLESPPHTIPLRNSSKEYFVPLHTIPSFHRVRNIERRSV